METVQDVSVSGLPKELGAGDNKKALSGGVAKLGVEAAKMYLATKTGGLSKLVGVDKALDSLLEKGESSSDIADKFQAVGVDRVSDQTVDQLKTATYQNGAVFNVLRVSNHADHDSLMADMPGFKSSFESYTKKYAGMMEVVSPSVSNNITSAATAVGKGDYKAMDSIIGTTERLGTTLDLQNQKKMQAAQKEASRGVRADTMTPDKAPNPKPK